MSAIKQLVNGIPFVGGVVRWVYYALKPVSGSRSYWEERYKNGGNSGAGSYGKFAEFKAEVVNSFVKNNEIESVIEFGCGDGNQITLADYPHYVGFDVSKTSIARCCEMFARDAAKSFHQIDEYTGEMADLTLSLDVIYHLIEDDVFENHMRQLFNSATRFVIIYASDTNENKGYENSHVRHRQFTVWVKEHIVGWSLIQCIPNKHAFDGNNTKGSFADFYIYKKSIELILHAPPNSTQ